MRHAGLYTAVFLAAGIGIAYQIVLMRVFSIAQWHHFAYMIISIAMLGFGASGTLLALFSRRLESRSSRTLYIALLLLVVALPTCYAASQCVPFETFQLPTRPVQLLYLAVLYVLLAIPFFLISAALTLAFFRLPERLSSLYAVNMAGSGVGAAVVVALLYLQPPERLPYLMMLPAAFATSLAGLSLKRGPLAVAGPWAAAAMALALLPAVDIRLSEYKGLSYARLLPDAREVGSAQSPLSQLTAIASGQIRETPGQISNYPWDALGPIPSQIGVYFDGGVVSPVPRFNGDLAAFAYLDYVTGAAAYRVAPESPEVLVLGAGGGTEVLSALAHGARHVTAVEVEGSLFRLLRENAELAAHSGHLYAREDVRAVVADGRGFVQATDQRFDLINMALLDTFGISAAGVGALNESYLYTREALALYLSRLTHNGVLALTRWVEMPPRDALKMFATAVEACELAGFYSPSAHLAFLRSWNSATILVSRTPLDAKAVAALRDFAASRWFDLCWLPGLQREEANQFILLDEPLFYDCAAAVLSGQRETFYRDAIYHLRPASDDRPYFFRFFKWSTLPQLSRVMGINSMAFLEWGYIVLLATLAQALVAALVLILMPLLVFARAPSIRGVKGHIVAYFLALGWAYMFLEIAFIQRLILFLAQPIYAVAVVLTAFLLFSGAGSLFAGRMRGTPAAVLRTAVGIACVSVLYLTLLPSVFRWGAGWSDPVRIATAVAVLAPLAFLMGIPFPLGLQQARRMDLALLPWAWGINGCASVVGAALATTLAVHVGFRALLAIALLTYFVAGAVYWRMERRTRSGATNGQQPQRRHRAWSQPQDTPRLPGRT